MSNRKLYMLKVACARLHDLKVQERRYKGALVKRACMHLLVKQADDMSWADARVYDDLRDDEKAEVDAKSDWNSGFWGTALGKFLRPYFENGNNRAAYIKRLTRNDIALLPTEAARRAAMERELRNMGVDVSQWDDLINAAEGYTNEFDTGLTSKYKSRRSIKEQQWKAEREAAKKRSAELDELGRSEGWLKDDRNEGGNPYYYGFGGPFRRSGYLTDLQAKYDPDFAREYGLGGGTVINNYYYGPDGKRHEVPPEAGTSPDPSKPGATTPGPDPNPDLPGLSPLLGTSDPGLNYLSGLPIDPKKISLYSGSNPLTTTGDPTIDLSTGSISIDPASLPPIDYLASPTTPVEQSPTISLIDTGGKIVGDIAGIVPRGKENVDSRTDWMKTQFKNLSPEIQGVIDTGVTALNDLSGKPKTSDPSSGLYLPPSVR